MIVKQMRNVLPPSRKEIVEAEHILPLRQQAFAQMRTNESGATSDKYSQGIFENASERYNDSVAANIGKRVFGVNKRSRKTKISNYSIQPVAYWCERLNTIRFRLLYVRS